MLNRAWVTKKGLHMKFKRRDENDLVLDSVGTTQTRFFQGSGYLSLLEQHLFPEWDAEVSSGSRARRIRIWSSGLVDQEGTYSLAMSLLERFPASSGWLIQIHVTDLLTPGSSLETSKAAGSQDEMPQAETDTSSGIEVYRINFNDDVYPVGGPFDLILCRNVLTCFTYQSKVGVARRARGRLSPAKHRSKTRT